MSAFVRFVNIIFEEVLMIKRAPRQPRHRNRLPATHQITVPAVTWTAAIAGGKVRVTTAIPVSIEGVPSAITVQGVSPTAITAVSATVFDLTYAATPVATNVFIIPAGVQAIQSQTGGVLAAGTYVFS